MTAFVPGWPLAVARIGLGLSALLGVIGGYGTMLAVADGRIQRPVWNGLPQITDQSALIFLSVSVPIALALTAGVFVRGAAFLTVIAFALMFAWEQQTYSNHVTLCALLCLWLSLSPSASRARLHDRPGGSAGIRFGDQVLLMTQLSVCYLFAALAKFNGEFLSGDVLRSFIVIELPDVAYQPIAVATVLTELFLAMGLWLRPTRKLAALVGVAFHVAIPAMMADRYELVSFSTTCLCLYPLFLTRPSLRQAFRDGDPLQRGRVTAEAEL